MYKIQWLKTPLDGKPYWVNILKQRPVYSKHVREIEIFDIAQAKQKLALFRKLEPEIKFRIRKV